MERKTKKNEVEKKKMKRKDRGVGWRESCSGKREEKRKKLKWKQLKKV